MVKQRKINSKLYRNTVTYFINPEILPATKKSLTSSSKILDCETPVNINCEQLASPPNTRIVSTPNVVNKNAQEFPFTDSAHNSPLWPSVAVTPKYTDFHADCLKLKDFFINETCILRKEVILNKQYVGQVLVDGNISSQTSKLKRIDISKDIIIQKLSSNKNITKEIPKPGKTDCSNNTGRNALSTKDVEIPI